MGRRETLVALVLFGLTFAVRFAFLAQLSWGGGTRPNGNAEMALGAASLARGDGLGNLYGDGDEATGPSAHVSPLYALWLAGVYRLFGYDTAAALFAQGLLTILVVSATVALIPLFAARARLTPGAGLLAGFGLALLPSNLWQEVDGAWEQPLAAAALLVLAGLFFAIHDDGWRRGTLTVAAGLWVGLIALLHPAILPAVVLFVLAEFLSRKGMRGRIALHTSAMLLCCLVVLSPWVWRNYAVFGKFIPSRSNFGLELWIGNNPEATGRTYFDSPEWDTPVMPLHPKSNSKERDHLKAVGEVEYMRERQAAATDWIRTHPAEFARLTGARFVWFWFPSPELWSLKGRGRYAHAVVFSVLAALSLAALVALAVIRHPYRWIFPGVVLGPTLVFMITHVDYRYRYPVFALTTLLACDLVVRGVRRVRKRESPSPTAT